MFNLASKVLFLFIEPSSLVLVLLVFSWFGRKSLPKLTRIAFIFAIVVFCFFSCSITSSWLVDTLENQYADRSIPTAPTAEAIVVLGGSMRLPNRSHPSSGITDTSDRLLMASRLYRAGKAPIVVVSGGDNPLVSDGSHSHESDEMLALLEEWGVPNSAILVDGASINTRENAVFSRRLLEPKSINHILLVTSAMHMPRAVGSFRKVGFNVDAAPADFRSGWSDPKGVFGWVPSPGALANSTESVHEWFGLVVYKLCGWI